MPVTGTTNARGYDAAHKRERERWRPIVEAGQAQCHAIECKMPSRAIDPDASWHLGHTADRSTWTGPEHVKCNTSDGGRRRHAKEQAAPSRWIL